MQTYIFPGGYSEPPKEPRRNEKVNDKELDKNKERERNSTDQLTPVNVSWSGKIQFFPFFFLHCRTLYFSRSELRANFPVTLQKIKTYQYGRHLITTFTAFATRNYNNCFSHCSYCNC